MRPISIEFAAFGSYLGEVEVDFTVLASRGLFLVTGDTGTGKTTIFDAMCYALYGEMPSKEKKDVRSHHAEANSLTFVKFTFECEGSRYVVRRTPDQTRPAKRGAGTTGDKATALLVQLDAAGKSVDLATKTNEVTDQCTKLVGLKAEQFQRVILLPQGEVAKFLLATSNDRELLLGQLFGGQVFDAIVDELKTRESQLHDEVRDVNVNIEYELAIARKQLKQLRNTLKLDPSEDLDSADGPALQAVLDDTASFLANLEADAEEATKAMDDASKLLTRAGAEAERFDSALELRRRLVELAAALQQIELNEDSAKQSVAARPVVNAVQTAERANSRLVAAKAELDDRLEVITELFEPLRIPLDTSSEAELTKAFLSLRAEVERQRTALAEDKKIADSVSRSEAELEILVSAKDESEKQLSKCRARLDEIADELPGVEQAATDLDGIKNRVEAAQTKVNDRSKLENLYEDLQAEVGRETKATNRYDEVLQQFVVTTAPRLAGQLKPGEACAVCGSTEHPNPAQVESGAAMSFDDVKFAASERDTAIDGRRLVEADLDELRGRLGADSGSTVDALQNAVDDLAQEQSIAEAAQKRKDELQLEQAAMQTEQLKVADRTADLGGQITGAQSALDDHQERARQSKLEIETIDPGLVDEQALAADQLAPLYEGIGALFDDVSREEGAAKEASGALNDALAGSHFETAEAAIEVLLPQEDEVDHLDSAKDHHASTVYCNGMLEALQQQGIPSDRPDLESVEAAFEKAKDTSLEMLENRTTATNARSDVRNALKEHDRLVADSGELREKHQRALRAHLVCSAGGVLKMPLRRWVLATELDRVSAAANVHLQRMTSSRYTLRRRLEMVDGRRAFGLDLEVIDAHTGRQRSTTSLSGGEQFQASLALALGLADVVSHGGGASGKRFEALFVDEGFGSLDPTALQEAIGALHQLHATGRMVGAITHVEAMKQDLHVGIEVTRRPDGKGSTLTVHP